MNKKVEKDIIKIKIEKGGAKDERKYSLHNSQILQPYSIQAGSKYFAVFVYNKENKRESSILIYLQSEGTTLNSKVGDSICSLTLEEFIPLNLDMDYFDLNYFFTEIEIKVDSEGRTLEEKG